jgi:hypothetical protein
MGDLKVKPSTRSVLAASLVAVVVLIFAWELRFQRRVRTPMSMAIAVARRSTEVDRMVGEPLRATPIARGQFLGDSSNGTADFVFHIRGPHGDGTLAVWAQEEARTWSLCGLVFRQTESSKGVDVIDEASTHCERE